MPSKPYFPKFPHLGVHVLGSWTKEYTFLVWKWANFISFQELQRFDHGCFWFLTGWVREERSDNWLKLSQLSITSPLALCHLRNDGILAYGERIHPLVDTCLFSDLIRQVMTWWEGAPAISIVAEIWLTSSRVLLLLRFVCGLAWPSWAL